MDALALPTPRVAAALHRVVGRYGRLLNFGLRDLQAALQGPVAGPVGVEPTGLMPLDEAPAMPSNRVGT